MTQEYRVAVDIGGTFTDVVIASTDGRVVGSSKILTTPADPADGLIAGVHAAAQDAHVPPDRLAQVNHATTLITNAIIQRTGARCALLASKGFRDTLEFQTETRYDLYDLHLRLPQPLIPRYLRFDVPERTSAAGELLTPVDIDAGLTIIDDLVASGEIEAVAICFLHAHVNSVNEGLMAAAIRERHPTLPVSVSSEVAPFIREYERSSTTAANAYVQPLASSYLGRVATRLAESGSDKSRVYLMLSHGGLTHLSTGMSVPIRLCESGPAAGVIAAAEVARADRLDKVVGFDMGGTTAKMCMILGGVPQIGRHLEVAHESRFMAGSGLPLAVQSVQLIEIGAGGGSIAHVDAAGLVEVGPASAGADPGPACYGRGGLLPTVTDANVLLGHLPASVRLGGSLELIRAATVSAFEVLGATLGVTSLRAARAVYDLVNEKMALAVRRHLVEYGHNPSTFTLVVTGGAGPMHACAVASSLGINRVKVPTAAGVGSALGLLIGRFVVERSESHRLPLEAHSEDTLRTMLQQLRRDAEDAVDHSFGGPYKVRQIVDVRYRGQGYELSVEVGDDATDQRPVVERVGEAFRNAYSVRFGRLLDNWPVEILAATVRLESPAPEIRMEDEGETSVQEEVVAVWHGDTWIEVRCVPWTNLPINKRRSGPLILTDRNTTVFVPVGWSVTRQAESLDLEVEGGRP